MSLGGKSEPFPCALRNTATATAVQRAAVQVPKAHVLTGQQAPAGEPRGISQLR